MLVVPSHPLLTPRENEVAHALARGLTCREIAGELHISVKTVDQHRMSLLKKLHCSNVVKLALMFVREGLVTL